MITEAALAAAATHLRAGERAPALAMLLDAWRVARHPRIANLVDFVSAELVAGAAPIKGKTIAARLAAWQALAATGEPAALGRMLATPWPGTWQNALPMLAPLCAWPDDPRIAMAFAQVVDACPFDTWTSSAFYLRLLPVLARLRDVRTLPLLRRALVASRSGYYARGVRPDLATMLAALEAFAEPALDAATEAALRAVEAPYREHIAAATAQRTDAATHLDAIYGQPDDLAARAVYADWLGDQGDPRGELITLQLARARGDATDTARAREHKLLVAHGKRWAGALDPWFDDDDRVFAGGFLAGGRLRWRRQYGGEFTVDRMLLDPAWALVRRLVAREDELLRELLDRAELRSLCELHVAYTTAIEIATGRLRPAVTALHWDVSWRLSSPPLEMLAVCEALPALREIGIATTHLDEHVAWLAAAPVVERIERLVLRGLPMRYVDAAVPRAGALRELEFDLQPVGHAHAGWRFVLARDAAPGPFTRFVARPRGGPHDLADLASVLASIPATVTELVITTPKKLVLPKREHAELVAALARFDRLARCELPWPELVGAATPPREVEAGPHFAMRVSGEPLFTAAKAAAVWDVVDRDLDLHYDSFEIGSKWRQLGDAPVARIAKWAGNARCYDITLFRDGARGRLVLTRPRSGRAQAQATLLAPLGTRTPEAIVAWWRRFLELGTFDSGTLDLDGVERPWHAFALRELAFGVHAAWLLYFGPLQRPLLPIAAVAALAARPALAGLFVHATTRGVLVGVAPTPAEITAERLAACAAGLREILVAGLVARLGYVLAERVRAALGPIASALELALVVDPATPFAMRFASADEARRITVEVTNLYYGPRLGAQLSGPAATGGSWVLAVAQGLPAANRAEIDAGLARVAATLRDHGAKLLASPAARRQWT